MTSEAEARTVHPDANDESSNHYDWFMPANPTATVDGYLDDFEAKMREALTDPFVHDMAQAVLPLIAAYREARNQPAPDAVEALARALRDRGAVFGIAGRYGKFNDAYYTENAKGLLHALHSQSADSGEGVAIVAEMPPNSTTADSGEGEPA